MNKVLSALLVFLCSGFLSQTTLAENSTRVSGFTIHHNAVTTDFLTPDVAKAYNIRRSENRAMLNISVVKDVAGTTGKPVTAKVTAKSTNLLTQTQDIPLREVKEGEAVYYIGEFPVANRANLTFDIEVIPEGQSQSHKVKFSQEFYTQ